MKHSSEIHSIQAQREQEYLTGWQRARAELQNVRKRFASQQQQEATRQRAQALAELLPIADHFRSLTEHVPKELEDHTWVQGVTHVVREFNRLLEELGVQVINPENEPFDPLVHEAVEQVAGKGHNAVAEVVQVGYKFGDTVLRPAKVKVAK